MKTIEIVSVGLRLVGIYGLLKGIQNIAAAYGSLPIYQTQFPDDSSYYFVTGGFVLAYFIGATVLIAFPVRLARILTPKTGDAESTNVLEGSDLQTAALSILGIYIVAHSLPMVFHHGLLTWLAYTMPDYHNDTASSRQLVYTASNALELSIGLYLSLQSAALMNLIHKVRELGMR